MGEIAESMLNGEMCEGCGQWLGEDVGYPQYCSKTCAKDRGMESDPYEEEREIFEAYGFNVRIVNKRHIQLRLEEYEGIFFDWYATTGTLVKNNNGKFSKGVTVKEAEEVAIYIKNDLSGKSNEKQIKLL